MAFGDLTQGIFSSGGEKRVRIHDQPLEPIDGDVVLRCGCDTNGVRGGNTHVRVGIVGE